MATSAETSGKALNGPACGDDQLAEAGEIDRPASRLEQRDEAERAQPGREAVYQHGVSSRDQWSCSCAGALPADGVAFGSNVKLSLPVHDVPVGAHDAVVHRVLARREFRQGARSPRPTRCRARR